MKINILLAYDLKLKPIYIPLYLWNSTYKNSDPIKDTFVLYDLLLLLLLYIGKFYFASFLSR